MIETFPEQAGVTTGTAAGSRGEVKRWHGRRPDIPSALLVCGLLVAVVLPLVIGGVTGSLSIPHNDAWSYSRIAQQFGRTGEIHLLGWNRASLVGQFLVLGPLARYLAVQQIFVALLAAVSLIACYDLLTPTVGRLRAAFAALLLAAWPELGLLSTSFMSDVPALTGMLCCLALGRRALASGSLPMLAASLAVGFWGVTVREQAFAAPAAVLVTVLFGTAYRRRFGLTRLLGLGVVFGVALVAFELWRRSLAGDDPPAGIPTGAMLPPVTTTMIKGYFLLALAIAPAVFAVVRPWRWSPPAWLASATAAGVAVLAGHDYKLHGFLLTDYLLPKGPYPSVAMGDRQMLPDLVLPALVAAAILSGVLLAGHIVGRIGQLSSLLRWFLVLNVGGLLAMRAVGQESYGRYFLVLIPALLSLLLVEPVRKEQQAGEREPAMETGRVARLVRLLDRAWNPALRAGVALTATALLAALSLLVTTYGSAFDAARWRAGEQLVARGVPASDIDAGFEWAGYHSANGVTPGLVPVKVHWYSWKFPGSRACYVVYSSPAPRPEWRLVRTVPYRTFVIAGSAQLWVYDTGLCAGT